MYKPINHPNSPQLFSPTDGIMLSKHKTNHLTPSAQSPTSKPPDFHKWGQNFHHAYNALRAMSQHIRWLFCPCARTRVRAHTHTHTHTHTRPWRSSLMPSHRPQDFWSDSSSLRGALLPTFHGSSIPIPHPQENFSDPQYSFRLLFFLFNKIILLS